MYNNIITINNNYYIKNAIKHAINKLKNFSREPQHCLQIYSNYKTILTLAWTLKYS